MPKSSNEKKAGTSSENLLAEHSEKDYLFFYSKESPFSNFYPASFIDQESREFFCSEQYMMYGKASLFKDEEMMAKILAEKGSSTNCKKYGQVKNFDDKIWRKNCERIVAQGCYLKFSQNPQLKEALLATGDCRLVEASPRDRIWGIGFSKRTALAVPRSQWGRNLLGMVLMRVRDQIREKE